MENTAQSTDIVVENATLVTANSVRLMEAAKQLILIQTMINLNKSLYEAADALTLEIKQLTDKPVHVTIKEEEKMFIHNGTTNFLAPEYVVSVTDNFKEKNTVFRTAGVKRFEGLIQTKPEFDKAEEKKSAKATKGK
jgi:hypothetical protein